MYTEPRRPAHLAGRSNVRYLAQNGAGEAVFEVRHGIVEEIRIIEEIGIGNQKLVVGRQAELRFLESFI
jgi:hypothetical protein